MEACLFLFIIFTIFAIGDILGFATKATISGIFVVMLVFIAGFQAGIIPADIFDRAGALATVSQWAVPFIIVSLGSGINVRQLLAEWRSVIMCIVAMAAASIGIFAISPLISTQSAIVAIPIINGGVFATQIMTAAAADKGATMAVALGLMVFAVQKLVGAPLASYFGGRAAKKMLAEYRANPEEFKINKQTKNSNQGEPKKKLYQRLPNLYRMDSVNLALTALLAFVAIWLGNITGLNYSIWALLLGIIAGELGIVPPKVLDQAKSSGVLMIALWGSLLPSLADISISELLTCGWQLVAIFAAYLVGVFVFCYLLPTWKIVRSKDLAMGVATCQLIGFPATMLVTKEISIAVGETPEEVEYLSSRLTPTYVIAGMASVTSLSIIIAGVMVGFL